MGSIRDLNIAINRIGKLIDASDRVHLCADFVRKFRESGSADLIELDRLIKQLLEAEDALHNEADSLK